MILSICLSRSWSSLASVGCLGVELAQPLLRAASGWYLKTTSISMLA